MNSSIESLTKLTRSKAREKNKWIEKRASKWLDIITFPIDRYFDDKQIIRISYQ